jgi:hypothetical protein
MKLSDFIELLIANTEKTNNIRTYTGTWYTGVCRIPDAVTTKIGKLVALLQAQIETEQLCQPDEYLLIYNFQPNFLSDHIYYCSLNATVKPINELEQTQRNSGKLLQIILNATSGEVINNTQAMLEAELITDLEIKIEKLELPRKYGNYLNYRAPCSYVALASYRPIENLSPLFSGNYNQSEFVQTSKAFNSLLEARHYLSEHNGLGKYIAEISGAQEDFAKIKEAGVHLHLIKVINFHNEAITYNPYTTVAPQAERPENKASQLQNVFYKNRR